MKRFLALLLFVALTGCSPAFKTVALPTFDFDPPPPIQNYTDVYFAGVAPVYMRTTMGTAFLIHATPEYWYWMTAYHVVDNADPIYNIPRIGSKPAPVLAIAPTHDLAILRQVADPTAVVAVLEFGMPELGDRCVSVGYSQWMGREIRTLHVGWVVSVTFVDPEYHWLMTHNAGGRGGNSGGPILNTLGQVIGVSTVFADIGLSKGLPNPTELCAVPGMTALAFWEQVQNDIIYDTKIK